MTPKGKKSSKNYGNENNDSDSEVQHPRFGIGIDPEVEKAKNNEKFLSLLRKSVKNKATTNNSNNYECVVDTSWNIDARKSALRKNMYKMRNLDYAKQYQDQYQRVIVHPQALNHSTPLNTYIEDVGSLANELDRVSTVFRSEQGTDGKELDDKIDQVIDSYFCSRNIEIYETTMNNLPMKLPIQSAATNLIYSIRSYNVVIVEGDTGTGKSTQLPYYLLEDCIAKQRFLPNIFVTQPRRIAARSIAARISQEHGWELGTIVGYQVGLEKLSLRGETRLTFGTAGVLLQKLITEGSLDNYTHIMIDEAHERDVNTDLLLMIIRKFMAHHTKPFRLIIMSATMDVNRLSDYFNVCIPGSSMNSIRPIISKITKPPKGGGEFDVETIYYDRLRVLYGLHTPEIDFNTELPEICDDLYDIAVKIIIDVIPKLDTFTYQGRSNRSTLVFLPGLFEINKLHKLLEIKDSVTLEIIPLHSILSSCDQAKVFKKTTQGRRKVILSTNIAESSLTLTDVAFVVDFCLTKSLQSNKHTNFSTLDLNWVSKNQAIQRAGRTGRCCPGKVFRLITDIFYQNLLRFAVPEILLEPLEIPLLKVKRLNLGNMVSLMAILLDPPALDDIHKAALNLKQLGAIGSSYKEGDDKYEGDITPLGIIMSMLPIDVKLSKLIVLGHVFDVLEDSVIIAACLSTNRSVVKYIYGNDEKTFEKKLFWANGSQCDLDICRRVFREYLRLYEVETDEDILENFCNSQLLDANKLKESHLLFNELISRLNDVNIKFVDQPNINTSPSKKLKDDRDMLRFCICGAFFPNYFLSQPVEESEINRYEIELAHRQQRQQASPESSNQHIHRFGMQLSAFRQTSDIYDLMDKDERVLRPPKLRFTSILQTVDNLNVNVEASSVNSKLLAGDYRSKERWLLVGSSVVESARGSLLVRDTSLLPQITGLPTLMALLFGQNYRLKYNEKLDYPTGVEFASGWKLNQATGITECIHRENVASLEFDVLLDADDFEVISAIRGSLTRIVEMTLQTDELSAPIRFRQEKLRELINFLVSKERMLLPLTSAHNLKVMCHRDQVEEREWFSLVKPLNCKVTKLHKCIEENLLMLESLRAKTCLPPINGVYCYLCSSGYGCPLLMYNNIIDHLEDKNHNDRLETWKKYSVFEDSRKELS